MELLRATSGHIFLVFHLIWNLFNQLNNLLARKFRLKLGEQAINAENSDPASNDTNIPPETLSDDTPPQPES